MPIDVRVDPLLRLRLAAAHGVLTDVDVLEGYGGVLADPSYDPEYDLVFDCSAIERLDVSPVTIRRIADLVAYADRRITPGKHPRVAIVAPGDTAFGMARMYETQREGQGTPRAYLVCRTLAEAKEWLDLPVSYHLDPEVPDSAPGTGRNDNISFRPDAERRKARTMPADGTPTYFRDEDGQRWAVTRSSVPNVDLVRLTFESERGERRSCEVVPLDDESWAELNDLAWQSILRTANQA